MERVTDATTSTRRTFVYIVDGVEFEHNRPRITGAEIMDAAGIPTEVGLLLCEEDGSQRQVEPEEIIRLKPGHRFRKPPRFKRG